MKRVILRSLLCGLLLSCTASLYAQDINPSVQWRFIISQSLDLQSGNFLNYEFPAEKNYDYLFNITHSLEGLHAVIMVYDMQDALVKKMVLEDNQLSIDLPFDVAASGTYRVIIGLTDPDGKKSDIIPAQFTLIRRAKI